MTRTKHMALGAAFLLPLLLAAATGLQAHEIKLGNLVIHHPWIKQPPGAAGVAGGYTRIDNTGKEDDTLVSVSIEGAPAVQIHEMKMEGDVMKMGEMKDGLKIPAGQSVELKPKSTHLMIEGLKSPYMEGEQVKGTFTFAKAGKVDLEFEVVAPGADTPMKH